MRRLSILVLLALALPAPALAPCVSRRSSTRGMRPRPATGRSSTGRRPGTRRRRHRVELLPGTGSDSSTDRLVLGQQLAEIARRRYRRDLRLLVGQRFVRRRTAAGDHRRGRARRRRRGRASRAVRRPHHGGHRRRHRTCGPWHPDFYVYRRVDLPRAEWKDANAGLRVSSCSRRRVSSARPSRAGSTASTPTTSSPTAAALRALCASAHANGLLCAPSVGPGYDARRARSTRG